MEFSRVLFRSMAAMLLLVYTVVSAQQAGWGSARTVGSFAAVAVLLSGLTTAALHPPQPLPAPLISTTPAPAEASRG